jgi:xylono-1,5-lactonase
VTRPHVIRTHRVVAQTRDRLGEGACYDASRDQLYWVDILGHRLHRYALGSEAVEHWSFSEPVCFAVPRREGGLLLGLASGLYVLEEADPSIAPALLWALGDDTHRLNDALVDPDGGLWFGVMQHDARESTGRLLHFDGRTVTVVDEGYLVPNGPAFDPTTSTLYHADSARRCVYAYHLNNARRMTERRVHIQFEAGDGLPDGMTIDADGFLWVAHWGGSRVSRFDPEGRIERVVALPVSQVTNCAFAGRDLDRLFVTSAADGVDEPLAGALFEIHPGVRGRSAVEFSGVASCSDRRDGAGTTQWTAPRANRCD